MRTPDTPGPIRLIPVGGFLGSGKTTLLRRAAANFEADGKRVALITNDQAPNLVDTELLRREGLAVGEVSGGCFCCRFDQLVASIETLTDRGRPDIVLAEPVGSCTDLAATVIRPLRRLYPDAFEVAPFTVLVDPARLIEAFAGGSAGKLAGSVYYILQKQLEEADAIVINKADLLSTEELNSVVSLVRQHLPGTPTVTVSARTGWGFDAWRSVVENKKAAGQRIVDVDYDVYADGERVLGWLNARVHLQGSKPCDWTTVSRDFLHRMQEGLAASDSETAHLKLLVSTSDGWVGGDLTRSAEQPSVNGDIAGQPQEASLVVNARAQKDPATLRAIFETALRSCTGTALVATISSLECFAPSRPVPTHRDAEAVTSEDRADHRRQSLA